MINQKLIDELIHQETLITEKQDNLQHPLNREDMRRAELFEKQLQSIEQQLKDLGHSNKVEQPETPEDIISIAYTSSAFAERKKGGIVNPPKVGTVYRIASEAIFMDSIDDSLFDIKAFSFDKLIFGIACLLQNDKSEPTNRLIDSINANYTARELYNIASAALGGSELSRAFEYFQLNQKKEDDKFPKLRADSIIHRHIGSYMKYFTTSEQEVKWNTTWENYLLYLNSIPSPPEHNEKADDKKFVDAADFFGGRQQGVEVRDADDIF